MPGEVSYVYGFLAPAKVLPGRKDPATRHRCELVTGPQRLGGVMVDRPDDRDLWEPAMPLIDLVACR